VKTRDQAGKFQQFNLIADSSNRPGRRFPLTPQPAEGKMDHVTGMAVAADHRHRRPDLDRKPTQGSEQEIAKGELLRIPHEAPGYGIGPEHKGVDDLADSTLLLQLENTIGISA
jgi:hypothetical protein